MAEAVAEVTETKDATPVETNAVEVADDKEAPKTEPDTTTEEPEDDLHLGKIRETPAEEEHAGKVEYKNLISGESEWLSPEDKVDALERDRKTLADRADRLNKVKSERQARKEAIEAKLEEADPDLRKAILDDYNASHLTAREAFEAEQLEANAQAFNAVLAKSSDAFWKQISEKASNGGVVELADAVKIAAELLAADTEYVKKLSIEDFGKTPTGKKELKAFKDHWYEEGRTQGRKDPPGDPKGSGESVATGEPTRAELLKYNKAQLDALPEGVFERVMSGG